MFPELKEILSTVISKEKRNGISFMTGAGISAESGIPTYRGSDGIWVKGTKFHKPEEFGTLKYFKDNQSEVWQYTLFSKGLVESVEPNLSHYSLAEIEELVPNRFNLITQNVDNLHLRAGSKKIFEIHGNYREIRCSGSCGYVKSYPKGLKTKTHTEELTASDLDKLRCPDCGSWIRPNLLWFDEYYNERLFNQDSALRIAKNTGILFIIGTSGATNLPIRIAETALKYGSYVVDINIEDNQFTELLKDKKRKLIIRSESSKILPKIQEIISDLIEEI